MGVYGRLVGLVLPFRETQFSLSSTNGEREMRPTCRRLLQIIPKSSVARNTPVTPSVPSIIQSSQSKVESTVIDRLLKRKQRATASDSAQNDWPTNLRIEPVVKKADLKNVHADIRTRMKELIAKET
ncbi:hypothetical protein PM082_019238 [Marasmius tenuissimus]|nr:hypothetical protein PM082_019238 [Marasmius tenuissimus]